MWRVNRIWRWVIARCTMPTQWRHFLFGFFLFFWKFLLFIYIDLINVYTVFASGVSEDYRELLRLISRGFRRGKAWNVKFLSYRNLFASPWTAFKCKSVWRVVNNITWYGGKFFIFLRMLKMKCPCFCRFEILAIIYGRIDTLEGIYTRVVLRLSQCVCYKWAVF